MTVPKRKIQIAEPSLGEEEWQALREPLMSGWVTQGPKVAAFERAFGERHQVEHALATTSCTTALHLILSAMGIEPDDEVIVPSFTWIATANVVLYCGAKPVFVDIDRETFNIDPAAVAKAVTSKTKAIIAVHLFGRCADIAEIAAAAPGIPIIEDAACAAGSNYQGKPAGGLGIAAAFSFHPRKSITTGEGGMATTNDVALAERMNAMRNHGASVSEEQRHHGPSPHTMPAFELLGFNYRMTDLQGAVGLVQLSKLDAFIDERDHWAAYYRDQLAALTWLHCPTVPQNGRHGWQAFVSYIDEATAPMPRNAIMDTLQAKGISTRPGTHAVHLQTYYRDRFGLQPDDLPVSKDCDEQTMALPLHNQMVAEDYAYIVAALQTL